MKITGTLSKMKTLPNSPIKYEMTLGAVQTDITSIVGKSVTVLFTGRIICENCGKITKKSFAQGHCYPCTMKLAACDLCILKPETCHYEKGTCREPEWGLSNCFKEHVVYLANSSGLKVGITRASQVPTRWMDQGATEALPILEVKNRFISGQVEMLFKKYIADKTDWRKMLKGAPVAVDLVAEKDRLLGLLSEELKAFDVKVLDQPVWKFDYPVQRYLEKINSFNLDKDPVIKGQLIGIKGQYLIFDTGVFNVRSYSGYEVTLEVSDGTENNLP